MSLESPAGDSPASLDLKGETHLPATDSSVPTSPAGVATGSRWPRPPSWDWHDYKIQENMAGLRGEKWRKKLTN